MPIKDKTKYYRDYYLRTKDLRKFTYYEKKDRAEEMNKLYAPYGGEKEFYTKYYKEWCKPKNK
tara:strand:- start:746 stop:934 length:189 start_codon:yes stop_codon:yes gene_type:complete